MTVPTTVTKYSCINFSLNGSSVPLLGGLPCQNSSMIENRQRDLTSGKSVCSLDMNANTVLPQLSLTNGANRQLLLQRGNPSSVCLTGNSIPQFYLNVGSCRRNSPKLSSENNQMKKTHNLQKLRVSNENESTEEKLIAKVETTCDLKTETVCQPGQNIIEKERRGSTVENKCQMNGENEELQVFHSTEVSSDSSEEDNQEVEYVKVRRRRRLRRPNSCSSKHYRLKHKHSVTKPRAALDLPKPTKTYSHTHILDVHAVKEKSDITSNEEKGNILATLPEVFTNKYYNSIPETKNESLGMHKYQNHAPVKITKVFLSERQSGTLKESGSEFPCAPPATPVPDHLKKYEYVASMADIRAQRTVKVRLEALEKMEQRKKEQIQSEKLKREKQNIKDRERELRHQQRLEIYALNKVMSDYERKNFEKFCKENGIQIEH